MDAAGKFSQLSLRVSRDEIGESLKLTGRPGLISFSGGWPHPELCGIFLWLTLPEAVDCDQLLVEAVSQGIAFVPGSSFFPNGGRRNTLRLSFSFATEQMIHEGIGRLARVIQRGVQNRT